MAPIAIALICIETLRICWSSLNSDWCSSLKSKAGKPAGVYLTAPRSINRADSTRRFISTIRQTQRPLASGVRLLGGFARFFLLDHLHHHRWRGLRLALGHRQVAQHGVVEAEA